MSIAATITTRDDGTVIITVDGAVGAAADEVAAAVAKLISATPPKKVVSVPSHCREYVDLLREVSDMGGDDIAEELMAIRADADAGDRDCMFHAAVYSLELERRGGVLEYRHDARENWGDAADAGRLGL